MHILIRALYLTILYTTHHPPLYPTPHIIYHTEAAILIGDIAETVATRNVNPGLAKKLHVLSALEIERHRYVVA
jgi:hypothetical protein